MSEEKNVEAQLTAANDQTTETVHIPGAVKPGVFVTLQFEVNEETGQVGMGVVKIPVDLRVIEEFQKQLAVALEEENMKFVIHKQHAFLVPIKTSSLILPV